MNNLAHKQGNPEKLILNGEERPAGLIPESELLEENRIVVLM